MTKATKRDNNKNTATWKDRFDINFLAVKTLSFAKVRRKFIDFGKRLRQDYWPNAANSVRNYSGKIKLKFLSAEKWLLKLIRHWRFLTIFLPSFIFFYYLTGSMIAEKIDVSTEYKPQSKHLPMFETAETMSFLLKREVDDKMWTPNLPFIFPAYVLDNMPNFQIGIVRGVKEVIPAIRNFERNTDAQRKDIKYAYKLLAYPPDIWLMSRKGNFNLAPSSNAQYRKAAAELHRFGKDGAFFSISKDLDILLQKISKNLQNIVTRNAEQQREKSSDWIDTTSDDLFYFGKGYAFALWQISKTAGADFKEIILKNNLYIEWTYLVNSLKKAAELDPFVVRNGTSDSTFVPNHLLMQNFYLQRAIISAERIRLGLSEETNAD
ncbi:MAG: DUF2333 family protein [Alphaproteobacteria bacterium]|nr:DUF2333 family protein [Alphaproteobacteria bacterium]